MKYSVRILMITLIAFLFGCGGGGGGTDNDDNNLDLANNFAGTWLISKELTQSYWIFNEDGTFEKKRAGEPVDSNNHFVGTYTVIDGALSGKFTNPGVGTGEIEATITEDDTLLMDFIEHWHTPYKVVPCVGVRQ